MVISRSSATRTFQERPARFAAAAALVSPFRERTLSRLGHEHGRIVRRACPFLQNCLRQSVSTRIRLELGLCVEATLDAIRVHQQEPVGCECHLYRAQPRQRRPDDTAVGHQVFNPTVLAEARFDVAGSGHDELTSGDIDRYNQERRATATFESIMTAMHGFDRVERRLGRESGDRGHRGRRRLRAVSQTVDEGDTADRPMPIDLPRIATDSLTRKRASRYRDRDGEGSHLCVSMDVPDGPVTIVKSSIRRRTLGSPLPSPPLVL